MAVPSASPLAPPDPSTLLTPILPALTAAAVSKEPAIAVLPLLTPILRQRVQFLSASSTEPWLRLLCYDASKAKQLADLIAASPAALEPHPVSGEVEVDWDYDSQRRYRRIDAETLQALFVLEELGIAFQLVYCVGDPDGGDGWKVGEVTVADKGSPFAAFGGFETIAEAEKQYELKKTQKLEGASTNGSLNVGGNQEKDAAAQDDDDDDDYWAQYDDTPGGQTPAQKASPAPASMARSSAKDTAAQEQDYYAQYDTVQPAMDNHDPDEEAEQEAAGIAHLSPPLGMGPADLLAPRSRHLGDDERIIHPRPESSASSNGEATVAQLEQKAGMQEQSEFGVKKHISRSIRSLFLLSRASGIERDEFERLVKTELDVLGMVEDES